METALGESFTSEEQNKVSYYINLISVYIAWYTGTSFERLNDQTKRLQSDYYGRVHLPGGPVHDVTSVLYRVGGGHEGEWYFNGINEIYALRPKATVDVTYSYGYETIPEDIEMVATEAVKRLQNTNVDESVYPVSEYMVGNISERYNIFAGELGGLFNDLEKFILDDYRGVFYSIALGFDQEDPFWIPESDTALWE